MTDNRTTSTIEHAHPGVRLMVILTPLVFSILTWTLIGSLFVTEQHNGSRGDLYTFVGLAIVSFVFWLATYAVAVLIDTHPHDHLFLIAAMTMTVVFSGFSTLTFAVMALVAGSLLLYRRGIIRELHERVRFTPHNIMRASLGWTLTFLFLAVSMQSLYAATPLQAPRMLIGNFLDGIVQASEQVAPRVIPGYERNKTLDRYYTERLGVETAVSAGESVQTEQVSHARQQLADYLRLPLTGRETMSEIVRLVIDNRVKPTVLDNVTLFLPLLVIALFLLLKLFSPLFWAAIVGVATGLFHLYRRFGVVRVSHETGPIDRLSVT